MEEARILLAGDSAVTVQFGETIAPEIYAKVKSLKQALEKTQLRGIIETIPTYRSLMVQYDPLVLSYRELATKLQELALLPSENKQECKEVITLPILFGGEVGPDLDNVAEYHQTTPEKIIELACSKDMLIYMLGFTPGYPYIGDIPEGLITPRLDSPRVKVPADTMGVGGNQLGVYSVDSPGGFRLLGKTPVHLYDIARGDKAVLLKAGAYIRFKAINRAEYDAIAAQVAAGTYVCPGTEG